MRSLSTGSAQATPGGRGNSLLRRFDATVGYGPKVLDRVLSLRRFMAAAGDDLAQAAFDAGYADQAHLSRECSRLTGLTPAALVRSR